LLLDNSHLLFRLSIQLCINHRLTLVLIHFIVDSMSIFSCTLHNLLYANMNVLVIVIIKVASDVMSELMYASLGFLYFELRYGLAINAVWTVLVMRSNY